MSASTTTTTSTATVTTASISLPKVFIDAHHHFLDTTDSGNKETFQQFLGSLVPNVQYLPSDYAQDVVEPLLQVGVQTIASVHMECMPNNGYEEAQWVESMITNNNNNNNDQSTTTTTTTTVAAIIASCNLASGESIVKQELEQYKTNCPHVRGIRWILDCVGRFQPNGIPTATHVATSRHDGIDYLRGSNGIDTYDGSTVPEFEQGFALLEQYGYTFDLQCAPIQLPAAATLIAKYPNIPVVIDHIGKPRMLLGPDNNEESGIDVSTISPNADELQVWRTGMKLMSTLPNVYVKLSMLGYAIPGWIRTETQQRLMKELVLEIVQWFGPKRCMVATNWWKSSALSDADGLSSVGPTSVELITLLSEWFSSAGYTQDDCHDLFCDTAKRFYKI